MGLGALALAYCSAAQAQSSAMVEPYRLTWVRERGAESCISGAALTRLLEQVLGSPATASGLPIVLEGEVAQAAPPLRWRVHVRVVDAHGELVGERDLTSAELPCSSLTSSVLLILAMSIDPNAARDGLPPGVVEELRRDRSEDVDVWPAQPTEKVEPRADASAQPATLALQTSSAPALRAARVAPHPSFQGEGRGTPSFAQLFGAAALSAQLLPELSPGLALGVRWALPSSWSFSAHGVVWAPREVSITSPRAHADGVSFGATHAATEACLRVLGESALSVDACAGAVLGFRWVVASALGTKDNPWRAYFAPLLGLETGFATGKGWFFRGGVTAMASLRSDSFSYRDASGAAQPLFAPSVVSGYTFFGLGKRL
jgi:hypothetical protein